MDEVEAEMALTKGQQVLVLLLGLAKFFVLVSLVHLLRDGGQQHFPFQVLVLGFQLFRASRRANMHRFFSGGIVANNSNKAGCGGAFVGAGWAEAPDAVCLCGEADT
jgi:hypothetical protein